MAAQTHEYLVQSTQSRNPHNQLEIQQPSFKKELAEVVIDFRPITIVLRPYEIIAKVLLNRLMEMLPSILRTNMFGQCANCKWMHREEVMGKKKRSWWSNQMCTKYTIGRTGTSWSSFGLERFWDQMERLGCTDASPQHEWRAGTYGRLSKDHLSRLLNGSPRAFFPAARSLIG